MKRKNEPGELEFLVLTRIGKFSEASVKDLERELGYKYAYTTLATVLTRLYKKKKVSRKKRGRQLFYAVKKNMISSILRPIIDKLFFGKRAALIQYLIDPSNELTLKEIEEIENALKKCSHE